MGEYIDRDGLINDLKDLPEQERIEYMGIYDCIKSTTAADVVEVVRCKDCKYLSKNRFYCEYYKIAIIDNGFCYRGAKMDGDMK